MLIDVTSAEYAGGYRLKLRFDDGSEGVADLGSTLSFQGVFAPLRDPAYFKSFTVNPDLGTVVWPTCADIAPERLHELAVPQALRQPAE